MTRRQWQFRAVGVAAFWCKEARTGWEILDPVSFPEGRARRLCATTSAARYEGVIPSGGRRDRWAAANGIGTSNEPVSGSELPGRVGLSGEGERIGTDLTGLK